jgi:hypothetical protein
MVKPTALFFALLLAACSGESRGPESPERAERGAAASGPAAAPGSGASPGLTAIVLPRLPDSAEGNSAALEGRLVSEGPCLYVDSKGGRFLIAALSPSLTWNPETRRLASGTADFAVGDEIMAGGSQSGLSALPWTVAPHPSCDSSRIWIATSVSARRR